MTDSTTSRFLTTEEASQIANVSMETILKYKELGLLRAFRVNGQEQFREDEIKLVFNSRRKTEIREVPDKKTEPVKTSSSKHHNSEENTEPPTLREILSEEISLNTFNENTADNSKTTEPPQQTTFLKEHDNSDFRDSFNIPSIELLELTRTLKDQLETIKEERNWLRRRVEKLESSIEREQMIVISKTETLRNLVDHSRQQKSPWTFLLPWNK